MSSHSLLEVQGLSKRFDGVTALDGIDLAIRGNEFFVLLGPSGCGKTTLLRTLAGFETPDTGRVLLDGEDITRLRPNRRPLNLMFQSYALFPHMSVAKNIAYGLEMERLPRAEVDTRVEAVMATTQLSSLARRRPDQLSGGQRQRVALARALVKRPRVLLLDEPLAALDKQLREEMQIELKRLQHEVGITFVVVTHDQGEALAMADRIAVLSAGRLEQLGPPHELYEYPRTRFVASFIGMMNFFEGVGAADGVEVTGIGRLRSNVPLSGPVTLAVRPERIGIGREQPDGLDDAVAGRVTAVAYHGTDLSVRVEVNGAESTLINARIPAGRADGLRLTQGEVVWCHWHPGDSRIIEATDATAPSAAAGAQPLPQSRKPVMTGKTIAFFPEAAFGPALNSVGIAQACEKLGHKAVFLSDPGFVEIYQGYGFEAHPVALSEPMEPEAMAKFWEDFINGHIPNFRKSPLDQVDNYVKDCWEAIVDSAKWAEKDLPGVLDAVKPDLICVDNVIMFPAIKRHGVPWVRIISCSENEIPDPAIPPHLSGCGENDTACFERYTARFNEVIKPIHDDYNAFLASCDEAPYPLGEFFESSPHMNLLLYPEPVKFTRGRPLDPARFQYLEGCVRSEEAYAVPGFDANSEGALLYISFGSLGAGDTDLLKRIIDTVAKLPYRALVNVGDYIESYDAPPPNVKLAGWYPQPSVIPQVDAVIHHGGNNSFTECLYFGKPAIIMPYVWDGHDNATRVQETGHGLKLPRYDWDDDVLAAAIARCLTDADMKTRLAATSSHMQARHGPTQAAETLNRLLEANV